MDVQYVGETLFWGSLGRFSLFLAFFSALFAAWSYYMGCRDTQLDYRKWKVWGRKLFYFHATMVGLASFALMFILLSHQYEYRYVWIHMENQLPFGYKVASFWAGQEGSLLFWALCQVVFGLLLIAYNRKWEAPVLLVFSIAQVFMISMLLGIRLGDFSIGLNPFVLLRGSPENLGNAFFDNPNYLSLIADGNGLNPLLRNFWMLSHPPVTFIGYAAVLVPFAFAIGALRKREFQTWLKPALPWTIMAVLFLGAGILLGGVWAYESLTFGGFWAWDPIENASLVPWLVLVAALHLMLVAIKKKHTHFPAFLFVILAFVLVIYATYLTRSGVLSETSVHSFGSDGMGRHIMIYLLGFLGWGLYLLFSRQKSLPERESEEMFTREFWMFVAALVLVLSAFQIIFSTSMPVINRAFGTQLAPPVDVVTHYNNWQLPFAVAIALLMGVVHFISWGKNTFSSFLKRIAFSLILSAAICFLILLLSAIGGIAHGLMLFSALFATISSLDMLFRFKRLLPGMGAAISHLAMAMFLLAVLITFSQKSTISQNTSGYALGDQFPETENLLLIKGEVLPMGDYHVTYVGKHFDGVRHHHQVDFLKNNAEGDFYRVFSAYPSILLNDRMGNVYEPYAKVFPLKDVFTYVAFAEFDRALDGDDFVLLETIDITVGDSISFGNNLLHLAGIQTRDAHQNGQEVEVVAQLELHTHFGTVYPLDPSFVFSNDMVVHRDALVRDLDLKFRFARASSEPQTIIIEVMEERPEFIIIKSIVFPGINLLWASIVIMMVGLSLSARQRWKSNNGHNV